jgi:hypothetical protein
MSDTFVLPPHGLNVFEIDAKVRENIESFERFFDRRATQFERAEITRIVRNILKENQ